MKVISDHLMRLLQQLQMNDPNRPYIQKMLNNIIYGSVLIYLYLELSDSISLSVRNILNFYLKVFSDILLLHQLYFKSLQNYYIEFISEKTQENGLSNEILRSYLEVLNSTDLTKTKNLDILYNEFKV